MFWLNGNKRRTIVGIVAVIVLSGGNAKADLVMDAVRAEDLRQYFGKGVSFSNDGLRLYIAANPSVPGGYGSRDICVVERESLDAPWGEPVNLGPNINTADHEGWPAVSPDELELYFGRSDPNNWYAMRSTRASKDDPWGPATEYTGVFPYEFSADGLTKYSVGSRNSYGGTDIWARTRATIDDDWGEAVHLGRNVNTGHDERNPSVSSDDLALFFTRSTTNTGLYMCVRNTTEDTWGPAVDVGSPVNGSWWLGWIDISPDGSTLYCNRLGGHGSTEVTIKPFVDFTEDGIVDLDDLVCMIGYWGTDNSYYDIGPMAWGDGVVDDADLEVLMSYYGQAVDYTGLTVIDVKPPHNPQPANGWTIDIEDVEKTLPLSWTPGDTVTMHDLYLGTNRAAVENANISDTTGVYRGEQTGNSYLPPEGLQAGETYYWRLDEVRSEDIVKKGEIWSFTVIDGLIVDNFESYTDEVDDNFEGPAIWNTWIDGFFVWASGAIVGYVTPPFAETIIVHGGFQAMPFFYDNDGTVFEGDEEWEATGVPYYSETQRTWAEPQDWTRNGVEVLSLWFHGDPDNAIDPLYVALEDNSGNRREIQHPHPAAVTIDHWEQWTIRLADFTGVDPTKIKIMSIDVGDPAANQPGGSGLVRIDDIELHRSSGQ